MKSADGPITNYDDLEARLSRMKGPAPGRVRVYRGQTKDFGSMLPTGLRLGAKQHDPVWRYCGREITRELVQDVDGKLLELCVEAIAQHYGPGSTYLDVTRSLDVAIWFALHDRVPIRAQHSVGPASSHDEKQDIPADEVWWAYQARPENGYLYVFDVPSWNGTGSAPHGALLDLSLRPILSESSRILAQEACLVAADPSIKGGDLREFYACEPIPVGLPMNGARRITDPTDALFPDPSEDAWYRFFLSIPLTWLVDSESRSLKLGRPLDIASYFYASKSKREAIARYTKFITPNPFYSAVEPSLSMNPFGSGEFRLGEATRILFETPILHWFLRYTPDMWNQAILAADMSDEVEELGSTGQNVPVGLTNVYMEFSPLENTDWGHLSGETDSNVQPLRALWLVRNGSGFGVYLFPQKITSRDANAYEAGPFVYAFDAASGAFWRRDPGKTIPAKADWQTPRDKAFIITLAVLRMLSPVPKADPSPSSQSVDGNGSYIMTIPIRGAAARLLRVADMNDGKHWYIPRDSSTNVPLFPGSITECVEVLRLECPKPWPQADAVYIRELIRERFNAGGTSNVG